MMTLFDDAQILKTYTKDIEEQTARQTEKKIDKKAGRDLKCTQHSKWKICI